MERIVLRVVFAGLFALVLYSCLVSYAHQWITWDDLTFPFVEWLLRTIGILALFPLIVFPVMFLFASRHGHLRSGYPEHKFFREWASIFRRPNKGGGRACFFVEDVEGFSLQRAFFRQEPIFLAEVKFKRKWMFRRGDERFILRVSDDARLQSFLNWAATNQIVVRFLPEAQNQRPS